jgi:hypothetical protein
MLDGEIKSRTVCAGLPAAYDSLDNRNHAPTMFAARQHL